MFARQRRDAILRMLARVGSASVSDLAAALAVSEITARRDLAALAEGRHDPRVGLTTPNISEAATNQALVAGLRQGYRAVRSEAVGVGPVAEPKGGLRQMA